MATDPAVAAIGIRVKMHPRQVVGCLVAVWCWADPLTADGFVPHATASLVDSIAGKKGFAAAMADVDWLSIESVGIRFPKWDRHNSESAKARAGESERKRIQRSIQNVSGEAGQKNKPCPEKCPDKSRTFVSTRGEERREENTIPPSIPPAGGKERDESSPQAETPDATRREASRTLPACLDTPAFREAWGGWLVHFAEAYRGGKSIAPATADKQLAKLAALAAVGGDKAAIAAIDNAMTRDLREPTLPLPAKQGQQLPAETKPRAMAPIPEILGKAKNLTQQ
ncbi:hypothetical protein Ga0100230_004285 [Opitutaceae bacterium TAV3]|nr:hypothetical protein Ga0100230_004285 [Opitutaceae bacterium TAV3]